MAVTFYSGFKDKFHALDFLTDNVFTGFQIKNKIGKQSIMIVCF